MTSGRAAARTSESADLEQGHAGQLLDYLQKTAHVPGPGVDLIYLESAGAIFDLDPATADRLERDAINHQVSAVLRQLGALEEPDQSAALRLLASVAKDSDVGVEGRNTISTLLQAAAVPEALDPSIVLEIAAAVKAREHSLRLEEEDLYGALRIALSTEDPFRTSLARGVLTRPEAMRPPLGEYVLRRANDVLTVDRTRLGEIVAGMLVSEPRSLARSLPFSESDALLTEIVSAAAEPIQVLAGERIAAAEEAADQGLDTADELQNGLRRVAEGLGELVVKLKEANHDVTAERAADVLASLNHVLARDELALRLKDLRPVRTESLKLKLLAICADTPIPMWPTWLDCLGDR